MSAAASLQAQLTLDAAGAGTATANGSYKEVSSANGRPLYENQADPDFEIYWTGSIWALHNTSDGFVYYENGTDIGNWVPRDGWKDNKGSLPVPTMSGSGTKGPLAGNYTVGGASPDFASIGAAVDSLVNNGILNDVRFRIRPGSYDEQVTIDAFDRYGSSTDSVLFTPESGVVHWEYTSAGLLNNWFILLTDVEHITIDGIDFEVPAGVIPYATIISYGTVDDLLIRNCEFDGVPNATTTAQILINAQTFASTNVAFVNNTLLNGYVGIRATGTNALIRDNTFQQQEAFAIEVPGGTNVQVLENTITDQVTSAATYTGIDLDADFSLVARNTLQLGTGGTGIRAFGTSPDVINNMVAMLSASADAGIDVNNGSTNTVYFNTVWLSAASTGTALKISSASSGIVFNNILMNVGGGSAFEPIGGSIVNMASNFNNLYTTGAVLVDRGAGYATLADWQAAVGNPDPNSVSKTVTFASTVSPVDLHLAGGSIGDTDLAGHPTPSIPTDLDGDARNTYPYMGADESTALATSLKARLRIDLLLEGAYLIAGQMSTSLNSGGHLETEARHHPYGDPPWNYAGTDSVAPGFFAANPDIVDWVYVRLYKGAINGSHVLAGDAVGFVEKDGDVIDVGGGTLIDIDVEVLGDDYHAAVYHRNHLGAIATDPISVFGYDETPFILDFDGSGSVFGTNPLKGLGGVIEGLWAADADANGQIIASDFNTWLVDTKSAATGYLASDFNMDGQVNASDFNIWLANTKAGAASQIP